MMPLDFQPGYPSVNARSRFRFEPFPRQQSQTIPGLYGSISPERDLLELGQPRKKSGFFGKLIKGTAVVGATILGGLAFKRYAPNLSSQLTSYIPGFFKQPVNYVAQTGLGQRVGYYGESLLAHAEGWFGQLKNLVTGFWNSGARQAL